MAVTYQHVPVTDEDDHEIELTGVTWPSAESLLEDEHSQEEEATPIMDTVDTGESTIHSRCWEEPSLPSTVLSLLSIPILFLWIGLAYRFTGRLWSVWVFVLHLQLRVGVSYCYLKRIKTILLKVSSSLATVLDIGLFGMGYPAVAYILTEALFRDVDDTINLDWKPEVRLLRAAAGLGAIIAIFRLLLGVGVMAICVRIRNTCKERSNNPNWNPTFGSPPSNTFPISDSLRQKLQPMFMYTNTALLLLNLLCILSVVSHFGPWPSTRILPEFCDPLDTTLCALPFPSFHHMKRDDTTTTGWRVDLKGLVPLRGGIPFHPKFLNQLDGFSTMAPILFYMQGLKEAHERGNVFTTNSKLQGPEHIEESVTEQSITLLINVDEHKLVHHSAEIDYLDSNMPLVMVIPAQPLKHQTHYAVAVVGAVDENGDRLPRTPGMQKLMKDYESSRFKRYLDDVFPAIHSTAPWVDFSKDPNSVQMLFDFVTMSEDSQLGPVRAVRDSALRHVDKWNWESHVELVSKIEHDCDHEDNRIAQTLHIHLDVPSFLKSRSRYSILDTAAIRNDTPVSIGKAKAMIRIPCSVKQAALGNIDGKPVKAIMEYGHGLFYNRNEVTDGFLSQYVRRLLDCMLFPFEISFVLFLLE
jgi:hypothetical protein